MELVEKLRKKRKEYIENSTLDCINKNTTEKYDYLNREKYDYLTFIHPLCINVRLYEHIDIRKFESVFIEFWTEKGFKVSIDGERLYKISI